MHQQGTRLSLTLAAPLRDDEIGAFAQQRLRASYRSETRPVDPRWVYLQSYTGESATDSPRAIHEELVRRHPDLVLHWGVADLSVPVPPGGVPVVIRSREWYDVLARSGSLVSNINFDRWFRKRPGQRVLQTFHGYPSKAMGQGLWATKEFPPRRVEIELARSRADWDVILTPVPEMDVHYRREYAFDGHDPVRRVPTRRRARRAGRDEVRERTRRLLGIRDDQTAVLYAPTWRDDLATNFRKARAADALDLDAGRGCARGRRRAGCSAGTGSTRRPTGPPPTARWTWAATRRSTTWSSRRTSRCSTTRHCASTSR